MLPFAIFSHRGAAASRLAVCGHCSGSWSPLPRRDLHPSARAGVFPGLGCALLARRSFGAPAHADVAVCGGARGALAAPGRCLSSRASRAPRPAAFGTCSPWCVGRLRVGPAGAALWDLRRAGPTRSRVHSGVRGVCPGPGVRAVLSRACERGRSPVGPYACASLGRASVIVYVFLLSRVLAVLSLCGCATGVSACSTWCAVRVVAGVKWCARVLPFVAVARRDARVAPRRPRVALGGVTTCAVVAPCVVYSPLAGQGRAYAHTLASLRTVMSRPAVSVRCCHGCVRRGVPSSSCVTGDRLGEYRLPVGARGNLLIVDPRAWARHPRAPCGLVMLRLPLRRWSSLSAGCVFTCVTQTSTP